MAKLDTGNDPRNPAGAGMIRGKSVDGAPGAMIPDNIRTHWNPGPIPERAAQSEADESLDISGLNP